MNVRGLVPSLGAGGSLIAAALCAAVLLSGMLAFRGEVGGTAEANSGKVTLPSRTVRAQTSSSGLVETDLALATVGRAAPPRRPRRPQTATTTRREPAPPPAESAPAQKAPAGSAPVESAPAPAPAPEPVTGIVQRAVAQVHAVADPVLEQVPEPTQQHAESLTQTVDRVAQTVDDVTGGLLP